MGKIERRNISTEFRAIGRKIVGMIPYNSLSEDLGGFREIISPGAFRRTLEAKSKVLAFWDHNTGMPLGSTEAGTMKLVDSLQGLHFEIDAPRSSWGEDSLESVRRGDITGCSFGFNVIKDDWETESDQRIRHLREVELFEISVVSFPAYPGTKVNVRNKHVQLYANNGRVKKMDDMNLREERNRVLEELRKLNDFNELSAEDKLIHERLDNEFDRLSRLIKQEERERAMNSSQRSPIKLDPNDGRTSEHSEGRGAVRVFEPGTYQGKNAVDDRAVKEERQDLNLYLRRGLINLPEAVKGRFLQRALMADSDVSGGFLIAGEQFSSQIIQNLMDFVFIRQHSTIIECKNAHSLGAPILDNDPGDPEWSAELKTGSEDSTMDFEKRELFPHPLARRIKISNTLLRKNPAVADLVRARLSYKFATVEENAFLNGTGSNQPLGVFTASDLGITTSRDVSTGNTTTQIKADNLIECKYTIKAQYRKRARWIFHRDALKNIRKLKDGEGNYLWRAGISSDRPDTILDLPFDESEYAPNTFTAGEYVGILGDFSYYWIADALDMQIQVLDQLYAETNQTGFIGRKETDGMPVLEEAFVRVKLAT